MENSARRDAALRVVAVLLPVGALVALHMWQVPLCPLNVVTGIPCPGCGLTRAAMALLRGDVTGAWGFHPFVFVVVPLLGWFVGRDVLVALGWMRPGVRDPVLTVPRWVWVVFLVTFVAVWGLRLGGLLGGHPDGFHPENGLLYRVVSSGR